MKKPVLITLVALSGLLWTCGPDGGSETSKKWSKEKVMKTGAEVTKSVGMTLIKTVKQKMSEGGVEAALGYCEANALAITDSLAEKHGVNVKRTALKTRNPKNNPTDSERKVLTKMAAQGQPQAEWTTTDDGGAVYYQPIQLQAFCQTCHGTPGESMTMQTDSLIKARYPKDRATGFAEGDLRGMWVVHFNEQ